MNRFVKLVFHLSLTAIVLSLSSPAAAAQLWVEQAYGTLSYVATNSSLHGVHVDVGVSPAAPGHSVGIVYTTDGWQTSHWDTLAWQANVDDGQGSQNERWRFELTFPDPSSYPAAVQFAVYVDEPISARTWNNNSGVNYTISPSSVPISIEARGRYSKTVACGGGACATGEYLWLDTRAQNLAYAKSVWVELTHDGWQTSTLQYMAYEQPLSGGDERWGIDLTLCVWWYGSACPGAFDYKIGYSAGGKTYVDDNGGNGYHLIP